MSLLLDLLTDLLASGSGPSSDRGLVAMFATGSFLCGGGTGVVPLVPTFNSIRPGPS
jgi:hypothetical protein